MVYTVSASTWGTMTDDLTKALRKISSDLPPPRLNLSQQELQLLKKKLGPRTITSILKAKKQLPERRIPFLFNSLDSQDVLDVLNNCWDGILNADNEKD